MRKPQFLRYILIFILAQIAWLFLLGLWIYWYISNHPVYADIGRKTSPPLISAETSIIALVGGLVLLIAVSLGMSLIFIRLNIQLKITQLYDNFIANITHELKSPLTSIQLYLETLSEQRVSGKKQREFIRRMTQDADRLNNLINSILEIAGLEQKKAAYRFEVHAADALVRSLVAEAAEQFMLSRDAIRIQGSAPCHCMADRNALKIVINNIVDNAVKYSTGRPEILVRYTCDSKNMVLEVQDKGIGITVNDQKRVFKKFQRIQNRDAPNIKGTGLGLYWVKEIVGIHRGRVSVHSEGKNKGSTFRLELPVLRTVGKGRSKRRVENAGQRKGQRNA